ncbi:Hypothetical predicted protein, partial [Mytilus galloprovincialis]
VILILHVPRQDLINYLNKNERIMRRNPLRNNQWKGSRCVAGFNFVSRINEFIQLSSQILNELSVYGVKIKDRARQHGGSATDSIIKNLSFLLDDLVSSDDCNFLSFGGNPEEGKKISSPEKLDQVLNDQKYQSFINDQKYQVKFLMFLETMTNEDLATLSDVKTLIGQLYSQLNVDQHQFEQEKVLVQRLEELKLQVQPYEKVKVDIEGKALKRTTGLAWVGLGLMSLQFGVLARLTWWEYSWDIMEPVTYFITYGTSVAMFAYFVLTRQEYNYETLRDRQYLIGLHKNAKKSKMSVETYNKLKEEIAKVEYDIKRLRDPLQLRVPLREHYVE